MGGAVLSKRRPAGEEGPDGALMVRDGIVEGGGFGEIAEPPVGGEVVGGPAAEVGFGMGEAGGVCVPVRDGGVDGGGGVQGAVGITAERVFVGRCGVVLAFDGFFDLSAARVR